MDKQKEIREVLNKKGIDWKISGANFMISCPFHDDRNPSFGIRRDGVWNCFSCGKGGSWRDLSEELGFEALKLSFKELVREKLAEKDHQESKFESTGLPPDFCLYNENVPEQVSRRISQDNIKVFAIGEARHSYPGYFVIPIRITNYESYACRHLMKKPFMSQLRWIFAKGFKKVLFPIPKEEIILTEGLISAFAVRDFGFEASCVFGHVVSDSQIEQLIEAHTKKVIILFDSYEDHFRDSVKKTFEVLRNFCDVSVMKMTKDPDEIGNDVNIFLQAYKERKNLSDILARSKQQNFKNLVLQKIGN